ncbi:MAG: hypothetical protein GY928_33895 [Colwellia sp.]|nr:hypothetical protein [Colwellia sp.]
MDTPKQFAELLNGMQYKKDITEEEEQQAKDAGIVIVFHASDDLTEFRGFISDEVGGYDGDTAYITSSGLLQNKCDCKECSYHQKEIEAAYSITTMEGRGGFDWSYQTDIPHETFTILDYDDKYCKGIVFSMHNLSKIGPDNGGFIVELSGGMWIAPWDGDPPRTYIMTVARRFLSPESAEKALGEAREYYPFSEARISRVFC